MAIQNATNHCQDDVLSNLDTKLLLALKELQELRNASTVQRQNYLRECILELVGRPTADMDIELAQFVKHPGKDKCNFTKLYRELGEDAKKYVYRGNDSIWIQNINLPAINEELERRGEIQS